MLAVFTYLIELHEKKLSSGALQQAAAVSSLEPNGGAAGQTTDINSSYAAGSQGDVIVLASTSKDGTTRPDSAAGKGYSSKAAAATMPASVELHPSVKRGKKKLTTKIKNKLSKAKFTECSIQ